MASKQNTSSTQKPDMDKAAEVVAARQLRLLENTLAALDPFQLIAKKHIQLLLAQLLESNQPLTSDEIAFVANLATASDEEAEKLAELHKQQELDPQNLEAFEREQDQQARAYQEVRASIEQDEQEFEQELDFVQDEKLAADSEMQAKLEAEEMDNSAQWADDALEEDPITPMQEPSPMQTPEFSRSNVQVPDLDSIFSKNNAAEPHEAEQNQNSTYWPFKQAGGAARVESDPENIPEDSTSSPQES